MTAGKILARAQHLFFSHALEGLRISMMPVLGYLLVCLGLAMIEGSSLVLALIGRALGVFFWVWAAFLLFRRFAPKGQPIAPARGYVQRAVGLVCLMALSSIPAVLKISLIVLYDVPVPGSWIGFLAVTSLVMLYSFLGTIFLRLWSSLAGLATGQKVAMNAVLDDTAKLGWGGLTVVIALSLLAALVWVLSLGAGMVAAPLGWVVMTCGAMAVSGYAIAVLGALWSEAKGLKQDDAANAPSPVADLGDPLGEDSLHV